MAFRGHDETKELLNGGNSNEYLSFVASYNSEVEGVVSNALKNATHTLPRAQKEILHVFSTKVKNAIHKNGYVRERFLGIVHVKDTASLTRKDGICSVLSNQNLDIQNRKGKVMMKQKLQNEGWDEILSDVKIFYEKVSIPLPHMSDGYVEMNGRACHQHDQFTVEDHYKIDIFLAVVDTQLQEFKNKFNKKIMELFVLSSTLDPKEMCKSMGIDEINKLVQKFYQEDFAEYEMAQLKMQFEHFSHECQHPIFASLSTIAGLSKWLTAMQVPSWLRDDNYCRSNAVE
ncbi:uncharacterized protein LOC141690435 [Apium graveolens]|uniref:uncharacterized protein LOC141690435 n=1 Tax=Apium graveolens TaxID=4045 RepID=UPI003D7AB362